MEKNKQATSNGIPIKYGAPTKEELETYLEINEQISEEAEECFNVKTKKRGKGKNLLK